MDYVTVSLAGVGVASLLAWNASRARRRRERLYASLWGGRVLVRARLQGAASTDSASRPWNGVVAAWRNLRARAYVHGPWPGGQSPCRVTLARRPRWADAGPSPFEMSLQDASGLRGSLLLQARVAVVGLAGALAALVGGRAGSADVPRIPSLPLQGGDEARTCPAAVGLEAGTPGRLYVASVVSPTVHPFKRGTTTASTSGGPTVTGVSTSYTCHQNFSAWHTNANPATHSNTVGRHTNAATHVNLDLRPQPQYPQ